MDNFQLMPCKEQSVTNYDDHDEIMSSNKMSLGTLAIQRGQNQYVFPLIINVCPTFFTLLLAQVAINPL